MIEIEEPERFKQALRLAKNISNELGLIIDQDMMKIVALSSSSIALLDMTRPFSSEQQLTTALREDQISLLEKTISNNIGSLKIDVRDNQIILRFSRKDGRETTFRTNISQYEVPKISYNPDNEFKIDAELLNQTVDEVERISEYIRFHLSSDIMNGGLTITAENENNRYENIIPPSELEDVKIFETFNVKVMHKFMKVLNNIKGKVTLKAKPSKPLLIEFEYQGFNSRLYIAQTED